MKNIALIGYRGSGKTEVARRIALQISWDWIDADVEIELAAGKSIVEIFNEDGEARFREWETDVLNRLIQKERTVLALGGGVVESTENCNLLTNAAVVWLRAEPATLFARIEADPLTANRRPDLTNVGGIQEITQVLAAREPLYRKCADLEVDTENKEISTVASEIVALLNLSSSDR